MFNKNKIERTIFLSIPESKVNPMKSKRISDSYEKFGYLNWSLLQASNVKT